MTNILWAPRLAMVIVLGWIVVPQSNERLGAAEVEADERDFSAEAEAAHGSSPMEALRDPELRRHYLDQYDHRRWQEWQSSERSRVEPKVIERLKQQGELPREIQQLQHALGGPQVDRFPSLREQGFSVPTTPARSREARSAIPHDAIRALRDAAAQLDTTANRLEQLELFAQADGLRQQAQRLRLDARGMSDPIAPTEPSLQPTPAQWLDPDPRRSPDWNSSMPQLQPSSDPRRARLAPPASNSPPTLEPVPQPEIPSDPPKPQPLLDSPEATPQPDVEVEG